MKWKRGGFDDPGLSSDSHCRGVVMSCRLTGTIDLIPVVDTDDLIDM